MQREFFEKLSQITEALETYILATVIAVRGSSSAKPGSKAIIHPQGFNLWGWVGGGCAESFIIEQALEALAERQTRVVTVDLDDELLGVGMPCGGYMDVYLEPILQPRQVYLLNNDQVARSFAMLAHLANYAVHVRAANASQQQYPTAASVATNEKLEVPAEAIQVHSCLEIEPGQQALQAHKPEAINLGATRPIEQALELLAAVMVYDRGGSGQPMSTNQSTPPATTQAPHLLVVGRGRIAEELARLGSLLAWPVTVNAPEIEAEHYPRGTRIIRNDLSLRLPDAGPTSYVVIASQHKGDHAAALSAIRQAVPYIGLIASSKRSNLVVQWLNEQKLTEQQMTSFHAPAGLELKATSPFHIASSIICQILALSKGAIQKTDQPEEGA